MKPVLSHFIFRELRYFVVSLCFYVLICYNFLIMSSCYMYFLYNFYCLHICVLYNFAYLYFYVKIFALRGAIKVMQIRVYISNVLSNIEDN